jgi:hypothetical protein
VPRYSPAAAPLLQIVVLKRSTAAVATSQEAHRSRRSGREGQHRLRTGHVDVGLETRRSHTRTRAISSQSITNAGTGRRRKNAAPEDSAERKFYTRQLQGIRFSREEAGQAAKAADSIQPFPLRLIQLA